MLRYSKGKEVACKIILAIDAGGIRCLIPAMVLAELQRRMRATGRRLALARYVNMFAGAGVGSLLIATFAYALAPEMAGAADPDAVIRGFSDAAKFFPKRIMTSSGVMRLDTNLFEAHLRQRYGEKTLVSAANTHVVFPAFDIGNRVPLMITNTDPVSSNFYLWQALRGVVAVVPYMSPALVENRAAARPRGTPLIPLVSGGRYADDPSLAAYVEARKLGWQEEGITLLSLGAGSELPPIPFINPLSSGGLDMTDVTEPLLRSADELHCPIANHVNMLMNGEARAFNGVSTRLTLENRRKLSYFRVNGRLQERNQNKVDFGHENIEQLKEEALRIIADHSAILDEVVSRMPTDLEILTRDSRLDTLPPPDPARRPAEQVGRQTGMPADIAEFI